MSSDVCAGVMFAEHAVMKFGAGLRGMEDEAETVAGRARPE